MKSASAEIGRYLRRWMLLTAEVQNYTFSTPYWFFSVEFRITGQYDIRVMQVAQTPTYPVIW